MCWRDGFLHRRSASLARAGDLLCIVLPSSRKPPCSDCWNHTASRPGVDGADCPQCYARRLGIPALVSLRSARSGQEVLWVVSIRTGKWRRKNDSATGQESKPECVRGTLGSLGQTRVPIQGAVPLARYPRFLHGTSPERANWRLIGAGEGIHWPELDEDISVAGLLAGRPSDESSDSLRQWLAKRHQP
jgi:Protein of unknown function (DUF2442)